MPFQSQKAKLQLSAEDREQLERFSKSRTEKHAKGSACADAVGLHGREKHFCDFSAVEREQIESGSVP